MDRLSHDQAALAARGIHLSFWGADEYYNRLNVGVIEQEQPVADYLRAHYRQQARDSKWPAPAPDCAGVYLPSSGENPFYA